MQEDVIQPQPVPLSFQLAAVTEANSGKQLCRIQIATVTGVAVYFLDSNTAKTIGEALINLAVMTAGSGIIIPTFQKPSLS